MTRRSRSLLVDATLGKIFTNTTSVVTADASKLIAGTKITTAGVSASKSTTAKITNNLSGKSTGIKFGSGGLIVSTVVSAAVAPTGRNIVFAVKSGTSYESASLLGTVELTASSTSRTVSVNWTVTAGHSVYIDITQVGNVKPGTGVGIQFGYYAG